MNLNEIALWTMLGTWVSGIAAACVFVYTISFSLIKGSKKNKMFKEDIKLLNKLITAVNLKRSGLVELNGLNEKELRIKINELKNSSWNDKQEVIWGDLYLDLTNIFSNTKLRELKTLNLLYRDIFIGEYPIEKETSRSKIVTYCDEFIDRANKFINYIHRTKRLY